MSDYLQRLDVQGHLGRNMKPQFKILVLAVLCLTQARGGPIDGLTSKEQAVRDRAAIELRSTFKQTPETKWQPLINRLTKGLSKKEVLESLRPIGVREEGGFGSGQSHSQTYRLDDEWVLICWFRNTDGGILFENRLSASMRHVWVAPAEDFSGVWTVYFVNGQKSHEIQYRDGKYFGTFTAYRSDGTVACVQNYSAEGADGEDTGYHPSGMISYQGKYRAGKQVGTWTWYDETGKVTSVQEHPKE